MSLTQQTKETEDFKDLPALPLVAQKIISLDMSQENDQDQLIPAICQCPVTTARIISTANSAAFFSRGGSSITSVREAVRRIGLKTAHVIAFSISAYSIRNTRQDAVLDLDGLWRHNMSTLTIVKRLMSGSDKKHRVAESDLALAVMLHDIGYIVLDFQYPASSDRFHLKHNMEDDFDFTTEVSYFFTTHAKKGADLLNKWNIPTHIVDAVKFHHETRLDIDPMGLLIRLAHLIQKLQKYKADEVEGLLDTLGISGSEYREIAADLLDKNIKIIRI